MPTTNPVDALIWPMTVEDAADSPADAFGCQTAVERLFSSPFAPKRTPASIVRRYQPPDDLTPILRGEITEC
jgi:hypothetical protein